MADLHDILKYAEPLVVVLKTTTRNNLFPEHDFSDMLGGEEGFDGIDTNADYEVDDVIYFSNLPVQGLRTRVLLSDQLQVTDSAPRPYSGKGGGSSISTLRIEDAAASAGLDKKFFDDTEYGLYVGGTLYKGEADEVELHWDEYAVWSSGRFTSFDLGAELLLAASRLPSALLEQFPINYHDYGQSKGLAKDYLIGSHRNHSPKPVEDGVHDFHDGEISDNDDTAITFFPVAALEDGELFGDMTLEGGATSGTSYDETAFEWTTTNGKKLVSTVPSTTHELTVDKNSTLRAVSGSLIKVEPETDTQKYSGTIFNFNRVNAQRLESSGSVPVVVTIDGDATHVVRDSDPDYYFKVNGPNTSSSTFRWQFDRPIVDIHFIVRSISGNRTLDNWSKEPDSISPAYDTHVSSEVRITNVGKDYIEYDYKGNGIFPAGQLTVFWLISVTLAKPKVSNLKFKFGSILKSLQLTLNATTLESVNNWSINPVLTGDAIGEGTTVATWDNLNSDELGIELATGTDDVTLELTELSSTTVSTYGALMEEGIIKLSPADGSESQIVSRMIDAETGDDTQLLRHLSFRARVTGRDSVILYWGYVGGGGSLSTVVTSQWQDIAFHELSGRSGNNQTRGGSSADDGLYLKADRSPADGLADYTVEVSYYLDRVANTTDQQEYFSNAIKVLDPDGDGVTFMPTFKMADIDGTSALPRTHAIYDTKGKVKVSPYFTSVTGKFHGLTSTSNYNTPVFSQGSSYPVSIAVSSNGDTFMVGTFTEINSQPRERILKVDKNGNVDWDFGNELTTGALVREVYVDDSDNVYISGSMTTVFGESFEPADEYIVESIIRLNSDGSIDTSFDTYEKFARQNPEFTTVFRGPEGMLVLPGNRFVIYGDVSFYDGVFALNSVMVDENADIINTYTNSLVGTPTQALVMPDGRLLFASYYFVSVVLIDGSEDPTFPRYLTGSTDTLKSIAALSDGRIIVVTSYGLSDAFYTMLDVDGTVLADFGTNLTTDGLTEEVVVDGDDNIYLFGNFSQVSDGGASVARSDMVKLTVDETGTPSIEVGFGDNLYYKYNRISTVKLVGDIFYLGGLFSTTSTYTDGPRLLRISKDGDDRLAQTPVNEVLSHISIATTGTDYIADGAPDDMQISVPFTQRKPLIDWVDDITSSSDMLYSVNSENKNLELRRRYNGGANPQDFRILEEQLVPDATGQRIKRVRTVQPESAYTVNYWDVTSDDTDPIDQVQGSEEVLADQSPKDIASYVNNVSDAQYLADTDVRDINGQSEYSMVVEGLGHNLVTGMVGYVYTAKTNGYDIEILTANEQASTGNTVVTVLSYDVRRK